MTTGPLKEISVPRSRLRFLRIRWLQVLLALGLLLFGIKLGHHAMQPKYEGKTVDEWFGLNTREDDKRYLEIYSSFGTNAVWFLWGEYKRKDSVITAWVMAQNDLFFGSGYKFGTNHEEQRQPKAMYLLFLLSDRCEPLIPEIIERLKSADPEEATSMVYLLSQIKRQPKETVPAIYLSLLSKKLKVYQQNSHIYSLGEFGFEAKCVLPELQRRFFNPAITNLEDRRYLAQAILKINGLGPELAIFTNSLVPGDFEKSFANIFFLERLGTNARPAADVLRAFVKTLTNEAEVKVVTNAIQVIDPEGGHQAP